MTLVTPERGLRLFEGRPGLSAGLTPPEAQALLETKFAPWLNGLGLVVESCHASSVRLRLPCSASLTRFDGAICSQALMACADVAMSIAICCAFGESRNVATVGQAISFMGPIAAEDMLIEATVQKHGRCILICDALFSGADTKALAAHATATWALVDRA